MKNILLYILFLPGLISAQEFELNIFPLDDSSERREGYESLYNRHEYRLGFGNYDVSLLKFIADTNFLNINGVSMFVKDTIGYTSISFINRNTNQIIYNQTIQIIDIPQLFFAIDKDSLFNSHTLSVTLKDELGKDCSDEYYFALCRFKILDVNKSGLFEYDCNNFEIKMNQANISSAKWLIFYGYVINKRNGLSSMVEKTEIQL